MTTDDSDISEKQYDSEHPVKIVIVDVEDMIVPRIEEGTGDYLNSDLIHEEWF